MKKIKLSKNNKQDTYKLLAIYNLNNYDTEYILYDKLIQLIYRYVEKTESVYDLFKTYIYKENYGIIREEYIQEYKSVEKRFKNVTKKMKKYNIFEFVLNDLIEFQKLGENIIDKSLAVFDGQFIDNGIKGLEYNNINIRKFKIECRKIIEEKFKEYFKKKYNQIV